MVDACVVLPAGRNQQLLSPFQHARQTSCPKPAAIITAKPPRRVDCADRTSRTLNRFRVFFFDVPVDNGSLILDAAAESDNPMWFPPTSAVKVPANR